MEGNKILTVRSLFAAIVIPLAILASILLYVFVLGYEGNFEGNDPARHGINFLGIFHKGGYIVPVLMSFFLMVFVFSAERFVSLQVALGNFPLKEFASKVNSLVQQNDIEGALKECDKQKGSAGNILKSVLVKYLYFGEQKELSKEDKIQGLQTEIKETLTLELPMLEKNMTIIATLASVSTLVGLLGTVLGMIKAFAALAAAGAPDSVELASGISEALINTALGIGASALAIIAYNYFSGKVETIKYEVERTGYTILNAFSAHFYKESLGELVPVSAGENKASRKNITLDMTAMCDMAFLLLTFFILTAKWKTPEPVAIDIPAASPVTAKDVLPSDSLMIISIDKKGAVYFSIDNQNERRAMIEMVDEKMKLGLSENDKKKFAAMETFGIPIQEIETYMQRPKETLMEQPGIPVETTKNELLVWIGFAKRVNPKLRIAIKGDRETNYENAKKVIGTLQDLNLNRMSFITNLRGDIGSLK